MAELVRSVVTGEAIRAVAFDWPAGMLAENERTRLGRKQPRESTPDLELLWLVEEVEERRGVDRRDVPQKRSQRLQGAQVRPRGLRGRVEWRNGLEEVGVERITRNEMAGEVALE